jgi:phage shock protein PspC (stress-responsive transcriptional regulator)
MSEHTTHIQNIKRLERPREGGILAGVSAGLGRYFDITPTVFRLAFVVLALLGGAGILVYIAAALVMPREGEDQSFAERALAQRREHPWRLVALGLIAIAILSVLSRADTWPSYGTAWFLAVVGLVVLAVTSVRRWRKLVVVLVTTAAVLVALAATAIAITFAVFDVSLDDGVGDRNYTPATVADVRGQYRLGIGTLDIDLSHLPANQDVDMTARVGIGDLRVIVPHDATIAVDAGARAGSVDVLGEEENGSHARVITGDGRYRLDLHVGAGQIDVERAPAR